MARPSVTTRGLAVARGDEPADLLITGGKVFVASTREWLSTSLAIADGCIVGWGDRDAIETVDVGGAALTPAFVDAHMHLESTKLWVDEFVRAVLPHGTTAVAADPHEIANVFGIPGVAALIAAAAPLPFTFGVCASSCVPASPFESSGADLSHVDVGSLIDDHGAIGVAEVMNFPGVALISRSSRDLASSPAIPRCWPVSPPQARSASTGMPQAYRGLGSTRISAPGSNRTTNARCWPRRSRSDAKACGCSSGKVRLLETWWSSFRWS